MAIAETLHAPHLKGIAKEHPQLLRAPEAPAMPLGFGGWAEQFDAPETLKQSTAYDADMEALIEGKKPDRVLYVLAGGVALVAAAPFAAFGALLYNGNYVWAAAEIALLASAARALVRASHRDLS